MEAAPPEIAMIENLEEEEVLVTNDDDDDDSDFSSFPFSIFFYRGVTH